MSCDIAVLGIETVLTMDARLGYTYDVNDVHANWTEVARSTEDRPLQCSVDKVFLCCVLYTCFVFGHSFIYDIHNHSERFM